MMKLYLETSNNIKSVNNSDIPLLSYEEFSKVLTDLLNEQTNHCLCYFAIEVDAKLKFICSVADDKNNKIYILSHERSKDDLVLNSLTPAHMQLHIFEREIAENFGVVFKGHPWFKPVRYPHDRFDRSNVINTYPFFKIEGDELHEVGVGPIHAGVIEPGHFRFICNGEKVLHLEIQLGYQHRSVEELFISKDDALKRSILSESIAGDTTVGHALTHCQLIESLADFTPPDDLQIERCIALELERIAIHIGDTSALCTDVGYQLGQVVCEALRTTIINTTQFWCGNRFGKGLIRPFGTNYPLSEKTVEEIIKILDDSGKRYFDIAERIYTLPSVLSRFDGIGSVTNEQALKIGAVGMAARTSNIPRDIRISHPFQFYKKITPNIVLLDSGDVLARGMLRYSEVKESIALIRKLLEEWIKAEKSQRKPDYNYNLKPNRYGISTVEGWRGEICHIALTDENGKLSNYKVKDPSLHNWLALALAVRDQEISDFPICNKSFNLSYCGNDL